MEFLFNQPVAFEESLRCEFKEVKLQPVQAIGKVVDKYVVAFLNEVGGSIYWGVRNHDRVVTGVPVTDKVRDELKQVIGQKVSAIAPPVPAGMVEVPFHSVRDTAGNLRSDMCVVEARVTKPTGSGLFLTGSGEAYRKTFGGTKKLSGAELFIALAAPLQAKVSKPGVPSLLDRLPSVHKRATLVAPMVHGRRVLWVDDHPSNNFYERVALGQMGVSVDVAISSEEGLASARYLHPDVIVSDMERHGQRDAGLQFLQSLRDQGDHTPVVFYVGEVVILRGLPTGAFGITDRPDEVLHLVLDVLERRAG